MLVTLPNGLNISMTKTYKVKVSARVAVCLSVISKTQKDRGPSLHIRSTPGGLQVSSEPTIRGSLEPFKRISYIAHHQRNQNHHRPSCFSHSSFQWTSQSLVLAHCRRHILPLHLPHLSTHGGCRVLNQEGTRHQFHLNNIRRIRSSLSSSQMSRRRTTTRRCFSDIPISELGHHRDAVTVRHPELTRIALHRFCFRTFIAGIWLSELAGQLVALSVGPGWKRLRRNSWE